MKNKLNSLEELKNITLDNETDNHISQIYKWRKMISKKNRKWFDSKPNVNNFDLSKSDKNLYKTIQTLFEDDKTRNFMIHLATNFLPLNNTSQCPILPTEKHFCRISGYELTDMMRIKTGDRNKAMGYVGINSNVILSADAVIELNRYVYEHIINFDTKIGHIVNHAFDEVRMKEISK